MGVSKALYSARKFLGTCVRSCRVGRRNPASSASRFQSSYRHCFVKLRSFLVPTLFSSLSLSLPFLSSFDLAIHYLSLSSILLLPPHRSLSLARERRAYFVFSLHFLPCAFLLLVLEYFSSPSPLASSVGCVRRREEREEANRSSSPAGTESAPPLQCASRCF